MDLNILKVQWLNMDVLTLLKKCVILLIGIGKRKTLRFNRRTSEF